LTEVLVRPGTCAGHQRVSPSGDLDLATAPALRAELVAAAQAGATLVVLDLEAVPFLDSVGVSVIVAGYKRQRHNGGRLHLAAAVPVVRNVLALTRIDAIIPTYATVGEAEDDCPSEHDAA
jgi:anti-sigma B factor antagonist